MKSILRIVAAIVFLIGLALFGYALFQTYLVGAYANKTVSVDLMDIVSLVLIVSGYWVIVKKKPIQKEQGTS